ncbi:hypothetical protein FRB99_008991 [Tulasnella sp. 403]|nr:hypothetical protein FRB99_008991 [Tulasnella sp. 403]
MFRPKREPEWEVVEHHEVATVPMLIDDADVEILEIMSKDISQVYVFDGFRSPLPAAGPAPDPTSATGVGTVTRRRSVISKFLKCPYHCGRHFFLRLVSSPSSTRSRRRSTSSRLEYRSPSSSSDEESTSDDDVHARYPWGSLDQHRRRSQYGDFSTAQMKDALEFARKQFMGSPELTEFGANALFSEGWTVTRLRKKDRNRLRIRYTGRPAQVLFSDERPKSKSPPFVDLLTDL